MNGIICINKPQKFTSFDVIAKLRGMLKIKRIGHSGTLDPMATGVLPVFIGNATKACDMLINNEKSYRAEFKLGITSDTQDSTGKILAEVKSEITQEQLQNVILNFLGDIEQIPPMYSAVSVNGKKLYDLARKGIEIERKPRKIHVNKLKILEFDVEKQEGIILIECSKGTYVRTIIHDIGQELSCGAVMTNLVRLSSNGFTLENCLTLEQVQKYCDAEEIENFILPVEKIFDFLPAIKLNKVQTRMYKNGVKLDLARVHYDLESSRHKVYGYNNEFLGVAKANKESMELRIVKNFFI